MGDDWLWKRAGRPFRARWPTLGSGARDVSPSPGRLPFAVSASSDAFEVWELALVWEGVPDDERWRWNDLAAPAARRGFGIVGAAGDALLSGMQD